MTPAVQILLSGALTFGVPIALAVRELIVLRRGNNGPGWGRPRVDDPIPPPAPEGGTSAGKPLPACLIPVRGPSFERQQAEEKRRVLEPV